MISVCYSVCRAYMCSSGVCTDHVHTSALVCVLHLIFFPDRCLSDAAAHQTDWLCLFPLPRAELTDLTVLSHGCCWVSMFVKQARLSQLKCPPDPFLLILRQGLRLYFHTSLIQAGLELLVTPWSSELSPQQNYQHIPLCMATVILRDPTFSFKHMKELDLEKKIVDINFSF